METNSLTNGRCKKRGTVAPRAPCGIDASPPTPQAGRASGVRP